MGYRASRMYLTLKYLLLEYLFLFIELKRNKLFQNKLRKNCQEIKHLMILEEPDFGQFKLDQSNQFYILSFNCLKI